MNKQHVSPTFVAVFADGTVTRMTTYCADELDLGRGARLSQAAYQSRRKRQPPAMAAGHFEMPPANGRAAVVLQTYTPDELAAVDRHRP